MSAHLHLKEYFCGDEDVGGDFLQKPAFRKKSLWCPDRNRTLVLDTYMDMLERKIFLHDLRVHYQRNISKEEQEALENSRGYINNSLHLARKYARIFVRGHYLLQVANSFQRESVTRNR